MLNIYDLIKLFTYFEPSKEVVAKLILDEGDEEIKAMDLGELAIYDVNTLDKNKCEIILRRKGK